MGCCSFVTKVGAANKLVFSPRPRLFKPKVTAILTYSTKCSNVKDRRRSLFIFPIAVITNSMTFASEWHTSGPVDGRRSKMSAFINRRSPVIIRVVEDVDLFLIRHRRRAVLVIFRFDVLRSVFANGDRDPYRANK